MITRSRATLPGLALVTAIAATGMGCIAVVPHEPRAGLVAEIGIEKSVRDLRAVIFRAAAPEISSVDVVDDTVIVIARHTHLGAFYQVIVNEIRTDLHLPTIERFEIYENHNVFVYRYGGTVWFKILFTSQEDARLFVDLMWSLKVARA